MKRVCDGGFTLMELMVVLALVGIMIGLGVPSMRAFLENSRLSSVSNDLLRSLNVARAEAIKRQLTMVGTADTLVGVAFCGTTDAEGTAPASLRCANSMTGGWLVFTDTNGNSAFDSGAGEVLIERHEAPPTGVSMLTDGSTTITYNAAGFAYPDPGPGGRDWTNNVVICDTRGTAASAGGAGAPSFARALLISRTGRARVSRVMSEVTTAQGVVAGSCP